MCTCAVACLKVPRSSERLCACCCFVHGCAPLATSLFTAPVAAFVRWIMPKYSSELQGSKCRMPAPLCFGKRLAARSANDSSFCRYPRRHAYNAALRHGRRYVLSSIQVIFLSFSRIRMPLKLVVVGRCRRLRPTCSFQLRSRPELRLSCVSVS